MKLSIHHILLSATLLFTTHSKADFYPSPDAHIFNFQTSIDQSQTNSADYDDVIDGRLSPKIKPQTNLQSEGASCSLREHRAQQLALERIVSDWRVLTGETLTADGIRHEFDLLNEAAKVKSNNQAEADSADNIEILGNYSHFKYLISGMASKCYWKNFYDQEFIEIYRKTRNPFSSKVRTSYMRNPFYIPDHLRQGGIHHPSQFHQPLQNLQSYPHPIQPYSQHYSMHLYNNMYVGNNPQGNRSKPQDKHPKPQDNGQGRRKSKNTKTVRKDVISWTSKDGVTHEAMWYNGAPNFFKGKLDLTNLRPANEYTTHRHLGGGLQKSLSALAVNDGDDIEDEDDDDDDDDDNDNHLIENLDNESRKKVDKQTHKSESALSADIDEDDEDNKAQDSEVDEADLQESVDTQDVEGVIKSADNNKQLEPLFGCNKQQFKKSLDLFGNYIGKSKQTVLKFINYIRKSDIQNPNRHNRIIQIMRNFLIRKKMKRDDANAFVATTSLYSLVYGECLKK